MSNVLLHLNHFQSLCDARTWGYKALNRTPPKWVSIGHIWQLHKGVSISLLTGATLQRNTWDINAWLLLYILNYNTQLLHFKWSLNYKMLCGCQTHNLWKAHPEQKWLKHGYDTTPATNLFPHSRDQGSTALILWKQETAPSCKWQR